MVNLTRTYLRHIKIIEEPIMHNHLSELKHPQWGSIIGYENQIRIAVLKDEMEIWQERMKSGDIFFKTFKRYIFTLESRIKELEDKETHSVEERIEYWKTELKDSSTEDEEEINTNILQNNEDWENEGGNSGSYNSAQMLNGSFEGDTISQIGKKHQKKEKEETR